MSAITTLNCACGTVGMEVEHPPIIRAECYCNSCRKAAELLAEMPSAPPVLNAAGGTYYMLYRKDRLRFVRGGEFLRQFRLSPEAPTRRVVAQCCNSPLFLEFEKGHWLSVYHTLWPANALPLPDVRTMTGDLDDSSVVGKDVPHGFWPTARFYARLLGAWIGMGFRTPAIAGVEEPMAGL